MQQSSRTARYAAVAATLALIVSLGGTSYAAVRIGTAQLKDNAVTSVKVRNGAITGADVAEGSLGTVPRATRATRADSVGGNAITKISFRATANTAPTVVLDARGLVITAMCTISELTLVATTTKEDSYISAAVVRDSNPGDPLQLDLEGSDFDVADSFDLLVGDDGDTDHVDFAYSAPDGSVATGSIDTDEGTPSCLAVGFVTSG